MGEGEGWKFAVSYGVVREGLTEKVVSSKQKPEEGASNAATWEKCKEQ